MYTYLLINIGTLLGPLLLSFDKRVAYYHRWKYVFGAMLPVAAVFIAWDIAFTESGIWSFNPDYLTGTELLGLPIEEWLFFFTIPFGCVFIYDCVKVYFPGDLLGPYAYTISWVLAGVLMGIGLLYFDQGYTVLTFVSLSLLLILNTWLWKTNYLGQFFLAFLIALLPFFLVNGVLTALPVVQYNDLENLGIRLGTIPIEDTFYGMLLLLMNVNVYEYLQSNRKQ